MSNRVLYRIVWIPSAIACVGMGVLFAAQPYAFPTPSAMENYSTKDKLITLKHPGNWKAHVRSGMQGMEKSVEFTPAKTVSFVVSSNQMGSIMADVSKSNDAQIQQLMSSVPGAPPANTPAQKSPLEKAHEAGRSVMIADDKNYPEYKEKNAQVGRISGVECLTSDFTFQGEGQNKALEMTGKRVTALTTETQINVLYYCPKDMQAKLAPTFKQMLQSVRVGQNGGN